MIIILIESLLSKFNNSYFWAFRTFDTYSVDEGSLLFGSQKLNRKLGIAKRRTFNLELPIIVIY